jgi:hypothetical protein
MKHRGYSILILNVALLTIGIYSYIKLEPIARSYYWEYAVFYLFVFNIYASFLYRFYFRNKARKIWIEFSYYFMMVLPFLLLTLVYYFEYRRELRIEKELENVRNREYLKRK